MGAGKTRSPMNAAVNAPGDPCDCEPFVQMPAWWSSFLFQLTTPRQLAVYTYIAMLGVPDGVSRPTVRQIQDDMGLSSDSVVFDALRSLEELSLIRRLRNSVVTGQNAYVRPACETTLVRLLETGKIDHRLRPISGNVPDQKSEDVSNLVRDGLTKLLGDAYPEYASAPASERTETLLALLRRSFAGRARDTQTCVCEKNQEP